MSIYSGFATRIQEETYDDCLDSVLYILQKRILKFYQGDYADEQKFINMLAKLHHQMKNMETHKYLEPKSSGTFQQLVTFLKRKQLKEASVHRTGAKRSDIDSIHASEFQNQKHPMVQIQVPTQGHSIEKHERRPETTHHKIRKRTSHHPVPHHNKMDHKQGVFHYASKDLPKPHNKTQNTPHQLPHQSSGTGLRSRKHRMSSFRDTSEEKGEHPAGGGNVHDFNNEQTLNNTETETEMRELIKGYISKTKKIYSKGYQRRKQELDHIFRDMSSGK